MDEEAGVWRSQTDGLFQETPERARELLAEGNVEVAIGSLAEERPTEENEEEEKSLEGPPENRSLSGPAENKIKPPIARERLEAQNVDTLRSILEEDMNVDLPSGYITKEELINRILEEN